MRLIDAEKLRAEYLGMPNCYNGCSDTYDKAMIVGMVDEQPTIDAVPWEFLERYADFFCAVVSMPEFVREAKAFYEGSWRAMDGGAIGEDGADNG